MIWAVLGASGLLAVVAAAGVLHPFRTAGADLEGLSDPLEDERGDLLVALRDLDRERATGSLEEPEYRALRTDTERRAVAVLRAIEARDGAGELAVDLSELRPGTAEPRKRGERSTRTLVLVLAVSATLVAVTVPLLIGAVRGRTGDSPISGSIAGQTPGNPLAFFQQRVKDHPNDVAARLDLAFRYLQTGDVQGAITQYLEALRLDPSNAEARANLGLVLFRAGRPEDGLRSVEAALSTDPNYAEALFYKGLILLQGLSRPADAEVALRAYLAAAPFGAYRQAAQGLLRQAEATPMPVP